MKVSCPFINLSQVCMRFYCFEVDYGCNDEYSCCWREDEDARFYNTHITQQRFS